MALETERKYLDVDFITLRVRLKSVGALCKGLCFEINTLYDNADKICELENRVIRLRIAERVDGISNSFTMKAPPINRNETENLCKIREELETNVEDAAIFNEMLKRLGYMPVLTYEKIRETWTFQFKTRNNLELVHVELDKLPFCDCVEVEASCDAINQVSSLLHLDNFKISTTSYTELYKELLSNSGGSKTYRLTFPMAEREALRKSIGLQ